jgi:hypothetical protein
MANGRHQRIRQHDRPLPNFLRWAGTSGSASNSSDLFFVKRLGHEERYTDDKCHESNYNVLNSVFFDGVRAYQKYDAGKDGCDAKHASENAESN